MKFNYIKIKNYYLLKISQMAKKKIYEIGENSAVHVTGKHIINYI